MDKVDLIILERCGNLPERIRACCSREVAEHLHRVVLRELGPWGQDVSVRERVDGVFERFLASAFDAAGRNVGMDKGRGET